MILLISSSTSQDKWYQQSSPSDTRLNSVYFLNTYTGWIVDYNGMIMKTVDGGTIWKTQTTMQYNNLASVFFINDSIGWVSGGYWSNNISGVLYKTTDGGLNWFSQINYYESFLIANLYFINEQTGWAVNCTNDEGWGVMKTNDGGNNWSTLYIGHFISCLYMLNELTGWASGCNPGATEGAVLKTTNGGINWTDLFVPISEQFNAIYFANQNSGWAVGIDGIIAKTIDGGSTWFEQKSTHHSLNAVQFVNENTGWIVGFNGILKTTNGGSDWGYQNITDKILWSVYFINQNTGWATGNPGLIYKTTDSGGPEEIIPVNYGLNQNYPNPFNPKTTITFSLPLDSDAKLEIFDISGKKVTTLISGILQGGIHNAIFDGTNLSSGVYFYKLTAVDIMKHSGTFIETKKMILVK